MFGTGPGQSHLIGLFFDPLSQELGLSRTAIAAAYGAATLVAAFLLPKLGSVIDRVGPARLLWILTLALGLACVLFSFSSSWLAIAIGFGCLRFLGQGSLMLSCNNLVSQWFNRKRGFALGIMSLGFPISMAVHPPLCQWLIETIGWRETWIWLGISTWIILLP
ncbi:MAG: MFS transporter, partial [Acidiferrobacteraceae bacterium]|nr:MFS transporter [Acidiferrobacteraceae bacterium]